MITTSTQPPPARSQRAALDRVTSFTDASVAIALTLLVLPLIDDIRDTPTGQSIWTTLHEARGDLVAFVVSFLVISQFWKAHRRLFGELVDVDERLLSLNITWVLLVVFLPLPTAGLFAGSEVTPDASVVYLGTMLAISVVGLAQVRHVVHHPRLLRRWDRTMWRARFASIWVVIATFTVAVAIDIASPGTGLLALVVLAPVQALVRAAIRRRAGSVPSRAP